MNLLTKTLYALLICAPSASASELIEFVSPQKTQSIQEQDQAEESLKAINPERVGSFLAQLAGFQKFIKQSPRQVITQPKNLSTKARGYLEQFFGLMSDAQSFLNKASSTTPAEITANVLPTNLVLKVIDFQPLRDLHVGSIATEEALKSYKNSMLRSAIKYFKCDPEQTGSLEGCEPEDQNLKEKSLTISFSCKSKIPGFEFDAEDFCDLLGEEYRTLLAPLGFKYLSTHKSDLNIGQIFHKESLDRLVEIYRLALGDNSGFKDLNLADFSIQIPSNFDPSSDDLTAFLKQVTASFIDQLMPISNEMNGLYFYRREGYEKEYNRNIQYIRNKFTSEERLQIVADAKLVKFYPGSKLNFLTTTVASVMSYKSFWLMTSEVSPRVSDLVDIGLKKVKYRGDWGMHQYFDDRLRTSVAALVYLYEYHPDEALRLIQEAQKVNKNFFDSNGVSETTRIEPFDLISNSIFLTLKEQETVDKAALKNFIRDGLYLHIHGQRLYTETRGQFLFLNTGFSSGSRASIFCIKPAKRKGGPNDQIHFEFSRFDGSQRIDHYRFGVFGEASVYMDQLTKLKKNSKSTLVCNGVEYDLELDIIASQPINLPDPLSFGDGTVDVLFTVSLVSEIDEQAHIFLETILKSANYQVVNKYQVDDLSGWFKDEMLSADVFMTAGHALNSVSMSLGTEKAKVFEVLRSPNPSLGETLPVRLKLVVPLAGNLPVSIEAEEFAEVYSERRKLGKDPIFTYVISCGSQNNLPLWSLIYQSSLDSFSGDKSSLYDFPYVIASERSFNTSSPVDLISHMLFPMDVMEKLSRQQQPQEIFEFLEAEKYSKLFIEFEQRRMEIGPIMTQMLLQLDPSLDDEPLGSKGDISFSPVFNLSDDMKDKNLNIGGLTLKAYEKASGNIIFSESI